jgi:hypothetical protein
VLHVLLCLAALFLQPARLLDKPQEQVVSVRMVPLPRPRRQEPAQLAAQPRPEPPAQILPPAPRPDDGMIRADRLYSGKMLADPRSRSARAKLAGFSPDERVVQLCNLEALEQVHRWKASLNPDLLVPYATADLRQSAHALEADGGAFRAGRHWFNIRFTCTVASDYKSVTAFAFKVGDEIPETDWARYDLLPDDGDDDDD